jgi:hypothetical protein
MTKECGVLTQWLSALGYTQEGGALHLADQEVDARHPYAVELRDLLRSDGQIRAQAVFDVHNTPTILFFEDSGELLVDADRLDALRQRIWNQNLISVVMVAGRTKITALPLVRKARGISLEAKDAGCFGLLSSADFHSNEIQQRYPAWFRPENRVDQQLLKNLKLTVGALVGEAEISLQSAQALVGQVLFVSYLEHRQIVGDKYRADRQVGDLHSIIRNRDTKGARRLIESLRKDFNGDFLSAETQQDRLWLRLSEAGFGIIADFLSRVDIDSRQQSFWNYDFSLIPVELLSGIYESFIGDAQSQLGAFYTPRHLANLVVDQAFLGTKDPLKAVIFDGACGSGILLTTAFRRLVGYAEASAGCQLSLAKRIALLKRHIFGSDLSDAACRVTAFSLYLSLLERLEPSDVLALQENENVKLPTLRGQNLFGGAEGDFFGHKNPLLTREKFTLMLSNPPWLEPEKDDVTLADVWATKAGIPRSRRQLAGDFAHRALDYLAPNGQLCFILPASLFLAPTSDDFLQGWMRRVRIERLINFGDMRDFIFETAQHSCAVVVATPRSSPDAPIPVDETFQYWAPKSDTGLAFGRLALCSADRFDIQTQAYFDDPLRLVTLMWGNESDIALWARLQRQGKFADMFRSPRPRWVSRKGVHIQDSNTAEVASAKPLWKMNMVSIDALKRGLPVVRLDDLEKFPRHITSVARLNTALMDVFEGPRILFPDGFDSEREIRASFIDVPASFTSSIGVIAGPESDAMLLRFAACYLRSDLARYFLIMRAYQVVCDRNRVTLRDIKNFPFIAPEAHPEPAKAKAILRKVMNLTSDLAAPKLLRPEDEFEHVRGKLNELIFDYFGLSDNERYLVREAVTELLPSTRPRGYKSLHTLVQGRADFDLIQTYANTLQTELLEWQESLGGNGGAHVSIVAMNPKLIGPFGAVRIELKDRKRSRTAQVKVEQDNRAVEAIMEQLRKLELHPLSIGENMYFAPDTLIWTDDALLLVRPLIRRFWLRRTAIRDAVNIVKDIHRLTE